MSRYVFTPVVISDLATAAKAAVRTNIPVRVYDRLTGGTPLTDLYTVGASDNTGDAIPNGVLDGTTAGVITPATFLGPDEISAVYFDYAGMSARQSLAGTRPAAGQGDAVPYGPAVGSDNWLKAWGANVDALIRATTITRSVTDAATGASVVWPDGTAGVYAGTESVGTPGAIDSYTITYLGATTKTVTQPAMTRNASGAVTTRPALTVS